jgi:(1->4)-alpha-D-glucan 1-alpha-D-glucosylmutase
MRIPAATYRVQFNAEFRFEHALALVSQLRRLGISHLYASPVFAARAGSQHGYDVIDPNRLNPELGTPEDFDRLSAALRENGMGLILDIVPNHQAASSGNTWWMDVLENGSASRYAGYFGVNWSVTRESVEEKIFLPILGSAYGAILDAGELKLSFEEGRFWIRYWETRLPAAPMTYAMILGTLPDELASVPDVRLLLDSVERLPSREVTEWEAIERRRTEKESVKNRIAQLAESLPEFRAHVERRIEEINADVDSLHAILEGQAYRLAYWMVARDRINYRRFFDVSDLIGIRVEKPEVLEATHELIFELLRDGKIDGLRIDHIDGLNDPLGYLERLPRDVYTVVEKILVGTEQLPDNWPIQGTSGYDFLGYANSLYVSDEGWKRLDWLYREVIGFTESREDVEYDRKRLALRQLFPGELADLGSGLALLAEDDRYARDLSPRDITRALREITANLEVYRTYTRDISVSEVDREHITHASNEAMQRVGGAIDPQCFEFVGRVLTLRFRPGMTDADKDEWVRFVRRWQQLSGPVMAKGVEDSTFYVYNRLVSLNEVGGIPRPVGTREMHEFLADRARRWPAAMNSSSTHDTKRSEDVRSRIHVLSELSEEWIRAVTRWRRMMRDRKGSVDDNEEYFIYQNLIGAWPLKNDEVPAFRERFRNYLTKAAREARVHTTWIRQNEEHERALHAFADLLFDDEKFQASFRPLLDRVAFYGAMNSLSQTLLKIGAPGVPDFYRGTITWDFSLVDPDNRRPVDFAPLTDFGTSAKQLLEEWPDGRVKTYVTERALAFRGSHAELFERGEYIPVEVRGKRADHVFAFFRRLEDSWVLVAVPRLMAQLSGSQRFPVGQRAWLDTELVVYPAAHSKWKNKLTDERLNAVGGVIPAAKLFGHFPVALLTPVR